MKVYVGKNKLLLVGKAWEIKQKLKEYNAYYDFVDQWLNDCSAPTGFRK